MSRGVVAVVIAAVALGGALWLHGYESTRAVQSQIARTPDGRTYSLRKPFATTVTEHPSWADPAAVVLAVVGVGFAGLLLVSGRSVGRGRVGSRV